MWMETTMRPLIKLSYEKREAGPRLFNQKCQPCVFLLLYSPKILMSSLAHFLSVAFLCFSLFITVSTFVSLCLSPLHSSSPPVFWQQLNQLLKDAIAAHTQHTAKDHQKEWTVYSQYFACVLFKFVFGGSESTFLLWAVTLKLHWKGDASRLLRN